MAIPAKTIDEVLLELDRIIESTVAENNFLGIFAFVYRRTTAQIKQAILENQFEDNTHMELMDVTFANFYLDAYQRHNNNLSCSASWQTAFTAKLKTITIIQHLLLGMNAHINLDLGIAVATLAPGNNLPSIKNDFMKVNQILTDLTNEMQERVAKVSRLIFILDWVGENSDEKIINFSMVKARQQSWNLACTLAELQPSEKKPAIDIADRAIADFGGIIINPPGKILKATLKLIAHFEEKNVKTILDKLREDNY